MFAADGDRPELTQLLLHFGADPRLRDIKGETAEDHARNSGNKQVGKIIHSFCAFATHIH